VPSVCVDASLVLAILLPEEWSDQAQSLWTEWSRGRVTIFAPPLLYAEVPSVLRQAVFFNRISPQEGEDAFHAFCDMNIAVNADTDLHIQAWVLAKEFLRPRVYDSFYLAAARAEGCELWTVDRRLVNAVNGLWVKWIGEYKIG
jgi:predicted nucleic acid-binding protein